MDEQTLQCTGEGHSTERKRLENKLCIFPMGSVRAVCNGKNHTREQYFLRTGKGDKGGKYIKKDEKHHMFVGQEVIFSFESAETPIDVKNIELLIQKFLM